MFYITNFTVGVPWTVTVVLDASGYSNTTAWPCPESFFTPWDAGNCDYTLSGYQTAPGNPTVILTGPDVGGCCPKGILTYFDTSADTCCVDNYAENPYRLTFREVRARLQGKGCCGMRSTRCASTRMGGEAGLQSVSARVVWTAGLCHASAHPPTSPLKAQRTRTHQA
eukprot:356052-Chlamydomonas_euryale.AAC.1